MARTVIHNSFTYLPATIVNGRVLYRLDEAIFTATEQEAMALVKDGIYDMILQPGATIDFTYGVIPYVETVDFVPVEVTL